MNFNTTVCISVTLTLTLTVSVISLIVHLMVCLGLSSLKVLFGHRVDE